MGRSHELFPQWPLCSAQGTNKTTTIDSTTTGSRAQAPRDVRVLGDDAVGVTCPRWRDVFVRNLPFYLDVGRFSRVRAGEFFYPTCIEKELAPTHPCKGKTATECRRRFMVAVT